MLTLSLAALGWLFRQNQSLHAKNLEILSQVLPLASTFPAAVDRLVQATDRCERRQKEGAACDGN
jgi:hypothetical protein